jgi:two-component system, OmpR family, response regulator
MNAIYPQTDQASRKAHILLVDDDQTFGESMGKLLRGHGFDVSLAFDFREALSVLERERQVDMLLVDVVMPSSVNGIALSRMARLRQRDLKVIYVTGYDIPGIETEALGPILKKPIDGSELICDVERLLTSSDAD